MKLRLAVTILIVTALSTAVVNAQGKSAGRGKPSTATSPANTTHGGGASGKPTTTPANTKHGGGTSAVSSTTTTTTTTTTGTTGSTSTTIVPNALTTKLLNNHGLLAKVKLMLPDGMTLNEATTGFRNQGQFIAALEASLHRNVSFADLQEAMTVDGLSLGQAVKQVQSAQLTTSTSTTTGTSTTTATK